MGDTGTASMPCWRQGAQGSMANGGRCCGSLAGVLRNHTFQPACRQLTAFDFVALRITCTQHNTAQHSTAQHSTAQHSVPCVGGMRLAKARFLGATHAHMHTHATRQLAKRTRTHAQCKTNTRCATCTPQGGTSRQHTCATAALDNRTHARLPARTCAQPPHTCAAASRPAPRHATPCHRPLPHCNSQMSQQRP
jgi:hypothetical protein